MLDNLLKLILGIGSQDLIADVYALESKFNKTLKVLKTLPKVEQLEIIRATQVAVYKEYKLTGKIWNTAADVQKCFSNLAYLHKLARARDAGEKILHAMKRVLLLGTPEEFNALSIKYATNHDKHAQDATSAEAAKIAGVKDTFTKALKVDELNKLLQRAKDAATEAIDKYKEECGKLEAAKQDLTPQQKERTNQLQAKIDALPTLGASPTAEDLASAFTKFAALKQLSLTDIPQLEADAKVIAEQTKKALDEAKAKEVKDQIIAAFKTFAATQDEAKADQGFIGKLQEAHQKLTTAIATIDTVDAALQAQVAKEVYDGISDIDASDLHAGVKIKSVEGLQASFANPGDITAGAEALFQHKAVLEAKSAGEAMVAIFTSISTANVGFNFAEAQKSYTDNHNMHALNVLENTAPNDELREIMFKAMEKELPFAAAVVRNLDLLKQKFIEMVEARK